MKITKKLTSTLPRKHTVVTGELLTIAAKLADQVQRVDCPSYGGLASWRETSVAALEDPDQNTGLIRACQIQRDAGALDADEALFVINRLASSIAEGINNTDTQLTRIGKAIKAAEKAHGLNDDE